MGLSEALPRYQIKANSADITATIAARLVSLRYTDEAGLESDALELVLADHDPAARVQLPATGAELALAIGYQGALQEVGLFVVDELELSGWPEQMTIRARAAVFEASKGGKGQLQSQKTRDWEKGTTIGAMARTIAAEHGLEAVVAPALDKIELPHTDQMNESDINFLVRILKKYDGLVKPAGGKLVVAKRGQAKSATGKALPAVQLTPRDVGSYRVTMARRETSGMVVAFWHATRQSERIQVQVGSGDPVTELKRFFPTEAQALAAARAEYDRRARKAGTLSLTLPGRADVMAEGPLVLAGFRPGVDGDWVVTRAEHSIDAGGYQTSIEAERPGAASETAPVVTGGPGKIAGGPAPKPKKSEKEAEKSKKEQEKSEKENKSTPAGKDGATGQPATAA